MDMVKISTVLLAGLCIVGCSSGQSPEPPPPAKNVFDPMTQQIGRAREVQGTVDANADATRKSVEKQESGDNPP